MTAVDSSKKLHTHICRVASGVCSGLSSTIADVGPVAVPKKPRIGLATYLCRVVVGQQLSVAAAKTIWGRTEAAAKQAGLKPIDFFARDDLSAVRACGVSNSKARALREIANAAATGRLPTRTLAKLDHEARSERLTDIWGVGQWTADMTSMFFFGDLDVWPSGDSSVNRALQGAVKARVAKKYTGEEIAARFSPYRTVLALYMYQAADAVP
ncbi:MAG: DNA-3-methyladenine glycosylase 2 family protein [Pseudomonadota bacterium]